MKAVKRWRYYCDFCKKVGGSRAHMQEHEDRCTLNPQRKCRLCAFLNGGNGAPLSEMLALLPDPAKFKRMESWDAGDEFGGSGEYEVTDDDALREATHAALPKLREITEDCPVCLMAALRQRGIPVPLIEDFNFTKEMEAARQRMNDIRAEERPSYSYY